VYDFNIGKSELCVLDERKISAKPSMLLRTTAFMKRVTPMMKVMVVGNPSAACSEEDT